MIRIPRIIALCFLILFVISPLSSTESTGITTPSEERFEFIPADISGLTRGPTVNLVTNHSALIFWRTVDLTNSSVEYGFTDSNLNMSVNSSTLVNDHRVNLTSLQINTLYYYRAISNGDSSPIYNFRTAPNDISEIKMIVVGDNRPDQIVAPVQPSEFQDLIDLIILEQPHLVIMTGDYVYEVSAVHSTNLDAWAHFTDIMDQLGHYAPIYGVIGNHDTGAWTGTVKSEYFLDAFEMYNEPSTYSSFDYAGIHIVLLDSEEQGLDQRITGTQYDWLVNDLNSTEQPLKFVFAHRPLYPCRHLGSSLDSNQTERERLQLLFEQQNVTLFAAGHDHLFNRLTVNGVVNIITGGGGAPPYQTPWGGAYYHYLRIDASPSQVNFTTIGLDGNPVDEYQLPYDGPIEIEIRGFANATTQRIGKIPEIYFSEIPVEKYFSWDNNPNTTSVTAFPSTAAFHILDVYAENEDGVTSHEKFVFYSIASTTTSTTTETTNGAFDIPLIFMTVGVGAVVVIVVLVFWRKR